MTNVVEGHEWEQYKESKVSMINLVSKVRI